jgi:membrane-associated protease RseP (regulator of RpoE activity)
MPSELRFCRNCGYRLGEGVAEYTETVRFANGQQPVVGMPPGQPLATTYGLSSGIAGAVQPKKKKRMSGMSWIFLGLLVFFIAAAAFTALITPMRDAAPAGITVIAPRSFVGVSGFETVPGGVTFDSIQTPGGPADLAGLVGGDIVTKFDGQVVTEDDDMSDLLRSIPIGKTVDVEYIRDGETKTTKLTTISREEGDRLAAAFRRRPEGRGRFGYDDGDTKIVDIPGTKIRGVQLEEGAIDPSLPADMAGIKDGDIIIEFAGIPIRTPEELVSRVRRAIPYTTVDVVVMRGTEKIVIPVKMGKG